MSAGLRFVDNFWESDFNGTMGFDLLSKRVREGQKMCKDIEDFFRKKSKAQLQYSKSLKSLTKSNDGREEIGQLERSFVELNRQTDVTSRYYEISAMSYQRLADDLARFTDSSKQVTKQVEDRVKEKQKIKKNHYNKTMELKTSYVEKCREFMLSENQYDVSNRTVTGNLKDREKLKLKLDKNREAMDKSDIQYKQALEALEQARHVWKDEMEEACDIFQRTEEDRINNLRDNLWKSSNIDSQLCVDWDQSCECIRLCLEKCDIAKDVNLFIKDNRTGSSRPAPIVYESYFDEKDNNKKPINSARNQPLPPLPTQKNNDAEYSYAKTVFYDS